MNIKRDKISIVNISWRHKIVLYDVTTNNIQQKKTLKSRVS